MTHFFFAELLKHNHYEGIIVRERRDSGRQLLCARNVNRRRCCIAERFVWAFGVETMAKLIEPLLLFLYGECRRGSCLPSTCGAFARAAHFAVGTPARSARE